MDEAVGGKPSPNESHAFYHLENYDCFENKLSRCDVSGRLQ